MQQFILEEQVGIICDEDGRDCAENAEIEKDELMTTCAYRN